MKRILLSLLFAPVLLNAQDDSTANQKCIRIVSVAAYGGGSMVRSGFEDRTVFQQAAPSSSLAHGDLTGYGNGGGWIIRSYGLYLNAANGLMVNFQLPKIQRHSEFRAGIQHNTTTISSQYYRRETSTQKDTTTLPGGGMLVTDSVRTSNYSYSWTSDILAIDLSWIVRSQPNRIVNVHTGFGIFGGIGFNGVIDNYFDDVSRDRNSSQSPTYVNYYTNEIEHAHVEEHFRAPGFGYYGLYIPVGFNIRLGRRNNFFGHMAIFGEYQGSIQIISAKGVDLRVRTASALNGGLRWYIDAPHSGKHKKGRGEGHKHHNGQEHE
ncbi:MAG TPA: hypothetical protein VK826_03135 [Bacteroidia bacterium]|nr:hypothetical protein [Bacteroidia bacterium]